MQITFNLLLQNIAYYLTKFFTTRKIPSIFQKTIINITIKLLKINKTEIKEPLSHFKTINTLFTRKLKESCRPIDNSDLSIMSPVDGLIQEFGNITNNTLIQAKDIRYKLDDLVTKNYADTFKNGSFITFYLSPKDCHLIFAPCNGQIKSSCIIPGKLFPVKQSWVSSFPNLYIENERVITLLETFYGTIAIIKVGALNVGNITTTYDKSITTNIKQKKPINKHYSMYYPMKKGSHLASFNLGSTVILLFQEKSIEWSNLKQYKSINYGQKIGTFLTQNTPS
ncbi:phosphatidylserine decarboxylase [Candidatus Marinamargulisbacteria bacterium SCGC AG-410-N11]|nr:phosphatidylserine decarboxylase [Candidatus Marinamargulisbacteria bacterium SCGC AG-410-N11]